MTERIARLGISIGYQDAARAKGELRGLATQARQTESATQRLTRETQSYGRAQAGTNTAVRSATGFMRAAATAATGLIAALGARQIIQYSDAWQGAINRLRIVIDTTEELRAAQSALFDVSQRTFAAFGATADLYSRLARSSEELGLSQQRLLGVTESVNKAVALSGASANSAQAALFQLGQGLAAGALRGEELNSVMEQTPALARAIAEGMGATIGELRAMGAEGAITAEKVIGAIENMGDSIDDEFAKLEPTFGQLFQRLTNEVTKFVGGQERLFQPFKNALQGLVDNFSAVTRAIEGATFALLAFVAIQVPSFAAQAAAALTTWFTATVRAARATNELNAAVRSGNALLLGSAAAQKAQAAFQVEQAAATVAFAESQAAAAATRLADARATEAQLKSTLSLITAQRAEAASRLELARGIRAATGLRTAQAAAEANLARTMAAGLTTRKALAATEAEIAAAQAVSASATTQLASAQAAHAAAASRAAASTGLFARALAGLRGIVTGLWALIAANPIGLFVTLVIGASAALFAFRNEIARNLTDARDFKELWRAIGRVFKEDVIDPIRDGIRWVDDLSEKYGAFGAAVEAVISPVTALGDALDALSKIKIPEGVLRAIEEATKATPIGAPLLARDALGRAGSEAQDRLNREIAEQRQLEQRRATQRAIRDANRDLGVPSFAPDIPGAAGEFLDPFGAPDLARAPIRIDPFKTPGLKPFEREQTAEANVELFKLNSLADAFAKGDRAARVFAEALSLADDKAAQVSETTLKLAGDIVTAQDRLQFNKVSAAIRTQIDELGALTKAYGESVEAGRVQEEAFKLFGDAALATSEAGLAKAREFLKAQDEAASSKLTAELTRQQEQLAELAGEYEKGERAARVYSEALKIAGQTSGEVTAQTLALAEAIVKAQETQRTLEATATIKRQADSLARLREGLKGSFRDFEVAAKQAELIADGWDEAAASSLEAAKRAVDYERTLQRINEQADRLAAFDFDPFEEFGDNIADVATDFFQQFREEGFAAFKDLGANFRDTFKRLGRDIFSKAVLEPILRPIIDAFGGGALGPNGPKDITLRETSRDITTEISRSTDSIVAAIRNGPTPISGGLPGAPVATGGPRNLITGEGFEEEARGLFAGLREQFGRIQAGYERMFRDLGKTLEGVSESFGKAIQGVSKQLGTFAAGASAGFAGFSLGSNAADFINGAQGETGSKVGGGVGGAAGFAFGGPAGAFIGSTVGSFLGDIFGSLFGKRSDLTAQGVFDPSTGRIAGTAQDKGASENAKARDELISSITNATQTIAELIGGKVANAAGTAANEAFLNVAVRSNRKTGVPFIDLGFQGPAGEPVGGGRFDATPEGIAAAIDKAVQLTISALKGGESALLSYAKAAAQAGASADEIANGLGELKSVLDLTIDPVSQFREALDRVTGTFADAATQAKGLAGAVRDLAGAEAEVLTKLAGAFDKDIEAQLRSIESPVGQQFFELLEAQQQRFSDADALNKELFRATKAGGGDVAGAQASAADRLAQVSALATAEFRKLIEEVASTPQALTQATEALAQFREKLVASGIDPAQIEQSLATARSQLAESFNEQVQNDILAFQSPTFAAFQDLLQKQKELEDFAVTVGGNIFAVQARNAAERQRFFKSLTDDQKSELGDFLGLIEDVSGRVAVVLTSLQDHISRYVDSADEQIKATERAAQAFQGYAQSIDDSLFNINTQFGAGNPEQRLQTLQEEFFRLASDAKGGDETAFEKLGPLGEQIVGRARELFAGTSRFASIRDTVTGALEGLRDFASERASALFSEAERFEEELEALKDIRNLLADPEGTDLLRDILESGRIQNDISRALVAELIALRDVQAQNDAVTLQQLQASTFAQSGSGGSQSTAPANDNSEAIVAAQQQTAKAYAELSRETAKTNGILLDLNASFKELTKEVNRERTQRAINE